MADFDKDNNRLLIKLVFYGPALSGKTTNLTALHDLLAPQFKGDMMILETRNDRTLFFDLLPLGFNAPSGLLIKLKLYTVPGQVAHDTTRKAVLSRADGIVFVADSQLNQVINNAESFQNLEENANKVGIDFNTIPLVVQFNKRDLAGILSEEEILTRWKSSPWPVIFAEALNRKGVIETLTTLLQNVYPKLDASYQLSAAHNLTKNAFVDQIINRIQ